MIDLSNIKPRQNKIVECIDYTKQQIDSSIWNRFDKIICIHYLPYVERFDNIKNELKRVGILDLPQFEWYYTVDNDFYENALINNERIGDEVSKYNIKYTLDSYSLLKKLEFHRYDKVLIIEDDVVFHRNLSFIKQIVNSTPSDFDVMNYDPFIWDREHLGKFKQVNSFIEEFSDNAHVFNMSCIGLSKKAISTIVAHQKKLLRPFDHYTWLDTNYMNTYCVSNGKNICVQDQDSYKANQCVASFNKRYPHIDISNYNHNVPLPKVAIVAIARLENDYINEWIEYHRDIGFSHIYIYDNSCGDEVHIDNVISFENSRITTVIPAYNKYTYQMQAYTDAYTKFGCLYEYMMFIDIDEFFTLGQHQSIIQYIQFLNSKCPGFDVCRINWEIYDDSNVIERDVSIPVHKFFTHISTTTNALQHNMSAKSLVKTKIPGLKFKSVHYPTTDIRTLVSCYSNGKKIILDQYVSVTPRYIEMAKIRHYMTKTISEFMKQKLCRDDAAGYITRNIENRFFNICQKTPEKEKYYQDNKDMKGIQLIQNRQKNNQDVITYYYWEYNESTRNAGDYYNKYLIEKLYKVKCMNVDHGYPDVIFCGSTIGFPQTKYAKYILGCGIQEVKIDAQHTPQLNPNSYLCVRGKITKDKLKECFGIDIHKDVLFFDPGLFVNRLYQPKQKCEKKYHIGIIPHYTEETMIRNKYGDKYHIISMKTDNIESLIDEIVQCDLIVSSSLHGIVFSHAYGIPAYHIEFKDFFKNGNFKFKDYYSGFEGLEYKKFICKNEDIPFNDIIEYDINNRNLANPSIDVIICKQDQFLKILPYQNLINEQYIMR